MPYDGKDFQIETKPIDRLIEALRGPEPTWWNFGDCQTCALHSAVEIGLIAGEDFLQAARALKMHRKSADVIFGAYCMRGSYRSEMVRPRHVAEALEHYRDTGVAVSPYKFAERERGHA